MLKPIRRPHFACSECTVHIVEAEAESKIDKLEAVIMHLEGTKCSHLSTTTYAGKVLKGTGKQMKIIDQKRTKMSEYCWRELRASKHMKTVIHPQAECCR